MPLLSTDLPFVPAVHGYGDGAFVETDISRQRAGAANMATFGAMMMALRDPVTWGWLLGGITVGIAGRIVTSPRSKLRLGTSTAALGAIGYGAYRVYSASVAIKKEMSSTGAAAVGVRVGKGATEDAKEVIAAGGSKGGAHDVPMTGVLKHYSCYESAKRDYEQKEGALNKWLGGSTVGNWLGIQPPARDPMGDCALTKPQLALIKQGFSLISRADRARLGGAYSVGQSLQDLGPAGA